MGSLATYFKTLFANVPKVKSLVGLSGIDKSEAVLHKLVAEKRVPGLAITILKNGETLLQKGFGYADIENKTLVNPKETIFRTASISKCITGLAFGKMVEEGILDWDDSFYKHVPYFPSKQFDFTLKQLASHTAGIRAYRGKEFGLNLPYTIKESLQVFENDPLVFEPGKGYLYNSFDFVLLSLAMQEASETFFEQYVNEKILIPLGLLNTFPPSKNKNISSSRIQNQAEFYAKTAIGFKKAIPVDNFYKLAGGGYLATCENIAKLGQAVLEEKLLKPETYKTLLNAQLVNGKSTYYGFGFQVSQDGQGRPFVGHVGSNVGAYTNLFIYPEEEMVISILVNSTDPRVQDEFDVVIKSAIEMQQSV